MATDWHGHFPNGAATVAVLIAQGADIDARFTGPHTENPVHRAAGSDDVEVRAVLQLSCSPPALRLVVPGPPRSITPTFTVNDLKLSLAWYRDGLGFFGSEPREKGGRLQGVMLKAGACQLGLSQDDFSKGRDRPNGVGFRAARRWSVRRTMAALGLLIGLVVWNAATAMAITHIARIRGSGLRAVQFNGIPAHDTTVSRSSMRSCARPTGFTGTVLIVQISEKNRREAWKMSSRATVGRCGRSRSGPRPR
ncbi:MAG: hypothetical protein H0W29_05710 [Gemmatimonadales bacterium]|nr:hypothetical protein [Gemmatimonadales bacterium]